MRKIEIRGKRKDTREWAYGFYVRVDEKHYIFTGKTGFSRVTPAHCLMYEDFERYEVIPESVGQYTGLDTAERKRIFEGDIITFPKFPENGEFVVVFFDGSFYVAELENYGVKDIKDIPKISTYWWGDNGHGVPTIVGNVHDTPELLIRK